ncbi:TetR family transcriptional regulator [Vibrio sp. 05-20-BW147]|uniref:outer membrane beta-barrel protein n=1 Tax=Vibrio sp. 05-20-BW147 TaxID=2575834 RepID=UPI00159404B1|nr:outer membrane beta-barrel protein [Vibrio sp. 05-20-BW147]NVC63211.1 TetR family transcriptional regulator [Vibrio sp. 05-20-BW147]
MNCFKLKLLSTSVFVAMSSHSLAGPTAVPYETESGISIAPYVNVSLGHNDNLAKTADNTESSSYSVIEPGVVISLAPGTQQHTFGYRIARGDYFSSSQDNFTDHFFDLNSKWELNDRHQFNLDYALALTHDSRGDNDTTLNMPHDEYTTNNLNFKYTFGRSDAIGRIETSLGWGDQTYDNNRSITRFQDWQERRFNTIFYYKALPKTALLFQIIANDKSYDETAIGASTKDSKHYFTYVGAGWDATGALQGNIKFGLQRKEFDADDKSEFKSFSWDADLTYMIRTYSALTLATNRRATDPDGYGNAIDTKTYSVKWLHQWNERVNTSLGYRLLDEQYDGSSRTDDTNNFDASVNYDLMRWLSVKAGIGLESKDSNVSNVGYDQTIYFVSLEGVM